MVRYAEPQAATRYLLYLEGGIIGRMDDMVTVRGVNVYPGADPVLTRSALAKLVTDKLGLRRDISVVEPETLPRFEMKGKRFFGEKQP